MLAELIRIFVAAACALFVLSLPLSKTESGATLRRWAGLCFVLALLPSLIHGLFYARSASSTATTTGQPVAPASPSAAGGFFSTLGCVAAVILVILLAYGILKLRSRFLAKSKPRDPWEAFFNRGGGKRPFTMHSKVTRAQSPYGVDDEDDD